MATAEFSKFAGILSEVFSQHHLLRFEIAPLEFHHHSELAGSRVLSPELTWLQEERGREDRETSAGGLERSSSPKV